MIFLTLFEGDDFLETIGWIIFGILILIAGWYTIQVVTGTDNLEGINLQLNDWYKENDKATLAVIEELKKQGKECEIVKSSKSFSEVIVEGKKYYVSIRVTNMGHVPMQTIQLKPLK